MKYLVAFFLCVPCIFSIACGQNPEDTLKAGNAPEKVVVDTFYAKHRANRAAVYSAILPGLGQVYNKKYWKAPLLYAGFAALGYSIEYNNRYYKIFRNAYRNRVDGDSTTVDEYENIYPDANSLLVRKDYYRRTRDLMWIVTSAVYVLNIIDAYVDAHLSDFDISDNLTMEAHPGIQFSIHNSAIPSLALTIRIK